MAANNPIDLKTTKMIVPLVAFQWGDGYAHVERFAGHTDDVITNGGAITWHSEPLLDVDLGSQHGGAQDEPVQIVIPVSRMPVAHLVRPYAHAPVQVVIQEVDPSVNESRRTMFMGWVQSVKRGHLGADRLALVEVVGWKSHLESPLGIQCNSSCTWGFGDHNCLYDIAAIQQTLTVTSVTATQITAPGLDGSQKWYRGTVAYDGLEIAVALEKDGDVLTLDRLPPPEWAGVEALFTPGCDKKIQTCKFYGNEHRFVALGIKMPNYQPQFESP